MSIESWLLPRFSKRSPQNASNSATITLVALVPLMTAILAVRYDKGVIIGSDFLKSSPLMLKPVFDWKLWPIDDAILGIAGEMPPNFKITFFDDFPDTEQRLRSAMVKFSGAFPSNRIHALAVSSGPTRKIMAWVDGSLFTDWWSAVGERPTVGYPKPNGDAPTQVTYVWEYLHKAKAAFPDKVGWSDTPQIVKCPDAGGLVQLSPTHVQLPLRTWNEFKNLS